MADELEDIKPAEVVAEGAVAEPLPQARGQEGRIARKAGAETRRLRLLPESE